MASFFTGVASASSIGLSFLYNDYKIVRGSISLQTKVFPDLMDTRISTLESLRQTEAPRLPQTTID
ncbi:unnamed protein product [Eruca vesicaria subsp. sativa]|uniref:Uncharacterized protein n=1 Tax=Eruca vesicaria subsp. sativa TaxID=29727 RepID=A0ABC8KSW6_ERUVS|nr:unnamed protein product [Eruca vesicaria subsp. sativa]